MEAQQQSGSHQNERSATPTSQTHTFRETGRETETDRQRDRQRSTGGTRDGDTRQITPEATIAALSTAIT